MKKTLIILLFIGCLFTTAQAQNAFLEWADGMGGTGSDVGRSVTTDGSGNVYTVGWFEDTVDFDPGVGVFNLISNGGKDIFIQKLDGNGNFIWAKSIGGVGDDRAYSIVYDNWLFITGWFEDTVDFNPGIGTSNLISNGGKDIFTIKMDGLGNLMEKISVGGSLDDGGLSITIDMWDAVSVTGFFSDTVDFNPDTTLTYNLVSAGGYDAFIMSFYGGASLNSLTVALSFGGVGFDWGIGIESDPWQLDYVYVTGVFENSFFFFDAWGNVFPLSSNGGLDVFVTKITGGVGGGLSLWVNSFGGSLNDYGNSLTNPGFDLYVTGSYQGTVDFNPQVFPSSYLTSVGGEDIFVQKLDEGNGNVIWTKSMGGTQNDRAYFIYSYGTCCSIPIYLTGSFMGTADFDPNNGVYNLTSNGSEDIFVQKMGNNGNINWTKSFGGIATDIGYAVTDYQNVHVTGSFQNTADFDPDCGVTNLISQGNEDIFVLKLGQTNAVSLSACLGYASPSGNYIWTTSGTYSDTIIGGTFNGCDSIFTINLTINGSDTSVFNFDPTLISNELSASYQWIDCNTLLPIVGDTNQSFTAPSNGSYAVVLTKNGCSDTSACITITNVGIGENVLSSSISIHPNPTSNQLIISSKQVKMDAIKIIDVAGKLVSSKTLKNNAIDVVDLPKGIYFIQLISKEIIITKKFVKN